MTTSSVFLCLCDYCDNSNIAYCRAGSAYGEGDEQGFLYSEQIEHDVAKLVGKYCYECDYCNGDGLSICHILIADDDVSVIHKSLSKPGIEGYFRQVCEI